MLKIRPAQKEDSPGLLKVLRKLDLFYSSLILDHFWVAEKDDTIVGTIRLEEYDNFYFLSCFGVIEKERKHGIATILLEQSLNNLRKKIYLYTIIPEFFKKFGFEEVACPSFLPSKEKLGCEECSPQKCACMLKLPHAT